MGQGHERLNSGVSQGSVTPERIQRTLGAAGTAVLLTSSVPAFAGSHAVAHYPSYYPDEIRIDAVDPATGAKRLSDRTLHAYIGDTPAFAGPVPAHVKPVTSLGSFLVLTFNPSSMAAASAESRCAAARTILATLREEKAAGFVFHPYPVTPYHADYLHHADLVAAAGSALGRATTLSSLNVGAKGPLAKAVVEARWAHGGTEDVVLEEVPVGELIADVGVRFDGWTGPPWIKLGWFQAYRLLASALTGPPRQAVDDIHQRLIRGEVLDLTEQVNLERRLITTLVAGCARVVVGYVPNREYINDASDGGVENVTYDSQRGLNTPVFVRTAKLKDYPWNGSLHLGVRGPLDAAWNPVAGFTDDGGALVWSAVGDPATLAVPFNANWIPNRVQYEVSHLVGQSGGMKVPGEAVLPEPGTGALRPVGAHTFSSTKVTYDILASPYLDGTEVEMADLLYPFVFVYRWGARADPDGKSREPRVEAVLAALKDRIVGLRPLRVDRAAKAIATGLDVVQRTPVLEVYLKDAPGDENQVAALAPPWSTLPWHVLALMEEAVTRGYAAFSKEEALRRHIPWLDLARDGTLREKLMRLVAEFERERFRPEALQGLVAAEDAGRRWRALKSFAEKNGHFLITNGPYRLKSWAPESIVLEAVREATYPLGFGTFDRFANPPRAVVREATRESRGIAVRADADITVKVGRDYAIRREPLTHTTARGTRGVVVVSRYLLIGPQGDVVNLDRMRWEKDNRFRIDLPANMPPGEYTVVAGIFLDGNTLDPSVALSRFSIAKEESRKRDATQ